MLSFIYNNQSILIVLGIVLLLLLGVCLIKKLPAKVHKKQSAKEDKKSDKSDAEIKVEEPKSLDVAETETASAVEENTQNNDDLKEKTDKKPKIVQIYKRTERQEEGLNKSKQDLDPIYNRNVEFINTSKNIAKFKSFAEEPQDLVDDNKDEFGFVADERDNCEFCENKVKHFDHSKRLSSIMRDDEEMFASHISDKYLNVNSGRHLNTERIENMINLRTEQMLNNSSKKIKCECGHDECINDACEMCEDVLDDDINIDMKTALLAETYFKRKSRR